MSLTVTGLWPQALSASGSPIATTSAAAAPELVDDLGLPAVPRRTEFFLFCLLLADGLVVAWTMLFNEARETT